jgi:flavin reductase (DIM6/NTAB) family NADH-FMN oxidoreductase RutF
MSLVPTSVSVLTCLDGNLIFGCTISSLVSVNINENDPEIIFVLKKSSNMGQKISSKKFFTINVLSSKQSQLAAKYSNNRDPDDSSVGPWKIEGQFAEILDSRSVIHCRLSKVYDSHEADIFVGSVLKYYGNAEKPALVYDSRKYGQFKNT